MEETAEKELLTAASAIADATQVRHSDFSTARSNSVQILLNAKKQAQEKREMMGLDNAGVDEAILEAARAIAQATHVLVQNATTCQKDIVASGKGSKTANVYRRDPTWARGLISAAQAVADSVSVLVNNASGVAQGKQKKK